MPHLQRGLRTALVDPIVSIQGAAMPTLVVSNPGKLVLVVRPLLPYNKGVPKGLIIAPCGGKMRGTKQDAWILHTDHAGGLDTRTSIAGPAAEALRTVSGLHSSFLRHP